MLWPEITTAVRRNYEDFRNRHPPNKKDPANRGETPDFVELTECGTVHILKRHTIY